MIQNEWDIKSRSHACTATGRKFVEGEVFYTLLFREKDGWRREDLCLDAWKERNDNIQPFSFWKTTYEPPPPAEPEALPRESAEGLLRRFINEDNPSHGRALYILAIMLERKKSLRHVETQDAETGPIMIYEHVKTGEIFLIPDPQLRLDQIEEVQKEVAALLDAKSPQAPASRLAEPSKASSAADESDTDGGGPGSREEDSGAAEGRQDEPNA